MHSFIEKAQNDTLVSQQNNNIIIFEDKWSITTKFNIGNQENFLPPLCNTPLLLAFYVIIKKKKLK